MENKIKIITLGDIFKNIETEEKAFQFLGYIRNLQEYYNDNVNKYEELIVKYSDLQEENERLKKPDYYEKGLIGSIKERDEIIQDYKSRCEKANEKIESIRMLGLTSGKTLISKLLNEVSDTLQGSDKE